MKLEDLAVHLLLCGEISNSAFKLLLRIIIVIVLCYLIYINNIRNYLPLKGLKINQFLFKFDVLARELSNSSYLWNDKYLCRQKQNFKGQKMSLLLLDESQWSGFPTVTRNRQLQQPQQCQQDYQRRINQSMQAQFRKHRLYTEASKFETTQFVRYFILFQSEDDSTRGVLSYNFMKKSGEIILSINILNHQYSYFKFENRHQTIQICKNLIFKEGYEKLDSKIAINMDNRQIKLQIPYFTLGFCNPFDFTYQKLRENVVLIVFKNFVKIYLPFIENVFQRALPLQQRTKFYNLENDLLYRIYKYSDLMMVTSHLNQNSIETERQTIQKENSKEMSIRKLCQNREALPPQLIKNCNLICRVPEYCSFLRSQKEFMIQGNELNMIQLMIAMPYQPKCNNPNDNTTILNHILFHQPKNLELRKINQGGFSTIFMGQIKFWYTQPLDNRVSSSKKSTYSTKNLLNKYAVIKVQEAENLRSKKSSRNRHELKIVEVLKLGSSIFLPKYYIPVNNPNPFPNSVILDFIPFYNLSDFLQVNSTYTSLITKLYLMFSIVQSLRYLRDYKIVHLDLKPNNIMIYCNMLVKLIDFGESYHPNVCKGEHKPGFTVPYSCPEIFQQVSNFTQKSDIFSVGVLFFQMLYGRYPFQILKAQPNMKIEMQQYLNYWYFSPEEYQLYGDISVLRILNNILSKCLSVDPNERPELDWLAVIIRLCFQLVS